mmetsp:Transcript_5221/g.13647  ORF Transcript_5221/g.13647 Transcript_5221/m.13647 type:complete len:84 (+) Transcript_5221:837-1088(+)
MLLLILLRAFSDLSAFAKEVPAQVFMHTKDGHESIFASKAFAPSGGACVCMNPGRLAKGGTGGTFSLLTIKNSRLEKVDIVRV